MSVYSEIKWETDANICHISFRTSKLGYTQVNVNNNHTVFENYS